MIYKQFNFLCLYFLVWKNKKDQGVICYLVVLVFITVIAEKSFLNLITMSPLWSLSVHVWLRSFLYFIESYFLLFDPLQTKQYSSQKQHLILFIQFSDYAKTVRHFNTTRFLPFSILKHSLSYTSISLYPLLKQRLKANVIL